MEKLSDGVRKQLLLRERRAFWDKVVLTVIASYPGLNFPPLVVQDALRVANDLMDERDKKFGEIAVEKFQ